MEENASRSGTASERGASLGWSIALSVLIMLAGLLAIALPGAAGLAANVVVAWLLMGSGVVHLLFAGGRRQAGAVIWQLLVGVVYIAASIYLITHPARGLAALTVVLAAYLVLEAALEFIMAFLVRPRPGWPWLLLDGIVTLVLAVLIGGGWPSSAEWALGTLIGVSLLFSGATRLMLSVAARGRARVPQVPSPA